MAAQAQGMVERRGAGLWLTHLFMITGVLIIFFPIWLAFVASTVTQPEIVSPRRDNLGLGHRRGNKGKPYRKEDDQDTGDHEQMRQPQAGTAAFDHALRLRRHQ